ncbi:hypothetical protein [Stenotrophomonas maltophilia]|uniref:hypothetical protein n=1 Tax=Stenotrophomonas maltophilia TaxID=40324 RepID=UPI000DA7D581|nr:hypothetical protein [Stenotrophomonas maltophilia]PZS55041.1 hypothetical protein A7X56_13955 [Stenotrophomonas maltophilia]
MPKQVRGLSVYRSTIERLPKFRLLSGPLTDEHAATLGLDHVPVAGVSIVPSAEGPATSFNARGKEIVRNDLPMITKSRSINTSWKDWHGHTHHGTQTRSYEAYPREQIAPPGEFLTAVETNSGIAMATRVIDRTEPEETIANLLNIYLECFPRFEIVDPNLAVPVRVEKRNWRILPPGKFPFERAMQVLDSYLEQLTDSDRAVAKSRIRTITRQEPDFMAIGLSGFSEYIVFGFTRRRRYVFESPETGNATYIFRNEWEAVSQLTKREILQENLQEARIIHTSRWAIEVSEAIQRQ